MAWLPGENNLYENLAMKSRLVLDASDCVAMTLCVPQHAPEMATQNSESDFSGSSAGTAACATIAD